MTRFVVYGSPFHQMIGANGKFWSMCNAWLSLMEQARYQSCTFIWERIIVHIHQNACSNIGAPMYECTLLTSEWSYDVPFIHWSDQTSELWCMNHRRPMVADVSLFEVAHTPINRYVYSIPLYLLEQAFYQFKHISIAINLFRETPPVLKVFQGSFVCTFHLERDI